jgi:hypothetical protein
VRDSIGAGLKEVSIVTRTWTGEAPGDGTASETKMQILPTPRIVDLSQSLKIAPGGAVQQGDIILKHVSKVTLPTEDEAACRSESRSVEKFWEIGSVLYQVISVTESHLTWNVQLRRLSDQSRY